MLLSLASSVGLDATFYIAIHILFTYSSSVLQQGLTGHHNAVICMCSLPDGGLATGCGKMDAQLCESGMVSPQLSGNEERVLSESAATLGEVGYGIFATRLARFESTMP